MPYKNTKDQRASAERHYYRNKKAIIQARKPYRKQLRDKNKEYVNQYKSEHGCSTCPMRDIRCLDFHHLYDKRIDIATAISSWTLESLKKEIKKCVILCANCHRIETAEARVAQLTEQGFRKSQVGGVIPSTGSKDDSGKTHYSGDGCTTHE